MCYSNCTHENYFGECTTNKPCIHAHCREDENGNPPDEEEDDDEPDYEEICTIMSGL